LSRGAAQNFRKEIHKKSISLVLGANRATLSGPRSKQHRIRQNAKAFAGRLREAGFGARKWTNISNKHFAAVPAKMKEQGVGDGRIAEIFSATRHLCRAYGNTRISPTNDVFGVKRGTIANAYSKAVTPEFVLGAIAKLETRKNKNREPVLRRVPMTDTLYEVFLDLYADRDPGKEWVFWTRSYNAKTGRMEEGPHKRGRYSMLRKICRDAGVDYYTFHRFRASGASVMDNSGALLPGIQRILGHADRRSTEIYLEKLRDVERDAMDVYERESRKDDDKVA